MVTIGLVDDHEILRTVLKTSLETTGAYRVIIEASNGAIFLDKLETLEKKPDLVLMDFQMPVMDGIETTKRIKAKFPQIKVILLTAFTHKHLVAQMIMIGIDGIISKCASMDAMREVLNETISSKNVIADENNKISAFSFRANPYGDTKTPKLSIRQIQFLKLCAMPTNTYKAIADELKISPKTVDRYRDELFKKLGVTSRTGLVIYTLQSGIVQVADLAS